MPAQPAKPATTASNGATTATSPAPASTSAACAPTAPNQWRYQTSSTPSQPATSANLQHHHQGETFNEQHWGFSISGISGTKNVAVVYLIKSADLHGAPPTTLTAWVQAHWGIKNRLH